jgi:energy-coupling factor transporter ATP-binding protein EcfA2
VTQSTPTAKYPRLLSFTLDGWDVLGDRVSVSLSDGVAVLVGRNGSGKSAILEGLKEISSFAVGQFNRNRQSDGESFPKILDIEILTPTERHLRYRYELLTLDDQENELEGDIDIDDIDGSEIDIYDESLFSWNDHCEYVDGKKETLWATENGLTTLGYGDYQITGTFGTTSLGGRQHLVGHPGVKLPDEIKWIHAILASIRILGKRPIRHMFGRRSPSLVSVSSKGRGFAWEMADILAVKIIMMESEKVDELVEICKRVGLATSVNVQNFILSGKSKHPLKGLDVDRVASVSLDDVNIGLLSDGTLRVLSILIGIITSSPTTTTIIEEPEVQIHPGMLAKLLSEIESYTYGENLILSTHSPQVVAWTSPDKINLVHRSNGTTSVRTLGESEIQNVIAYLSEEGSLGEWLYGGIVDE